jgi:outer membrane immunogenic protein
MRIFRQAAFGSVVFVVCASIASAADMPVKASPPQEIGPQDWTGLRIGVNLGFGSLRDSGSPYCYNPAGALNGIGCVVPFAATTSGTGILGGGQVGYNWQSGRLVYGVETDFQGTTIKGSANIPGPFAIVGVPVPPGGTNYIAEEKLNWLGTVRGRLGLAWDRALIYGTGGLAYGGVSTSSNLIAPEVQYPSSGSTTKAGWTLGGGVEWAFAPKWSAKVEGLYYDLGSVSIATTSTVTGFTFGKSFDVRGGLARIGLNYKLN